MSNRIKELERENEQLKQENQRLEERIKELEEGIRDIIGRVKGKAREVSNQC